MKIRCVVVGFLAMSSVLLPTVGWSATPAQTAHWITRGPVRDEIGAVAIAPSRASVLYASAGQGHIYKSLDGGRSWFRVGDVGCCLGPPGIAIDPRTPDVAFAVGGYLGLFKTTDGGTSWPQIGTSDTEAFAILPSHPDTLLDSDGDNYEPEFGLSVSFDGGLTWAPTGFVAQVTALALDPVDDSIVYAGLGDGRVFRRSNGAWISVSAGLPADEILTMAIDPMAPNILYVGTADGVYRRASRGHRWKLVSSGFDVPWTDALAVDPSHEGVVYAGTAGGGVYRSADSGRTWLPFNDGLVDLDVRSLAITPSGSILYAGTGNSGVFQTLTGAR